MRNVCRKTSVHQLKTGFIEVTQSLYTSSFGCLSGRVIINRKTNWLWLQVGVAEADAAQLTLPSGRWFSCCEDAVGSLLPWMGH